MSVSRLILFILFLACLSSLPAYGSFAAPPLCARSDLAGLADSLRSQCPIWIELSLPEEVNSKEARQAPSHGRATFRPGKHHLKFLPHAQMWTWKIVLDSPTLLLIQMVQGDTLDKKLAHVRDGAYFSVLFHASWCPFSRNVKTTFDALSSMFPQIWHLTVEESSAMPRYNDDCVFSRYGIRSFPSILLANRTAWIRYHGSKDLDSLAHFYRQTTGQYPVAFFHVDQQKEKVKVVQPWHRPAGELLKNEPYLAFSLLFVFLRAFAYFFPKFISEIKAFWMVHTFRHVNFGTLSELSQPLVRFLHVIDMKRAWNKLRLSNTTRNFHKGAKNARVWASSLASVSLGESSSLRSTHLN